MLDRRETLALAGLGLVSAGLKGAQAPAANGSSERPMLWYRQPARMWLEALPIGNGRIGAMVHGGIRSETLQLNADSWWAGRPYDPVRPGAREALPEVRRLVFAGRYAEAEALANRTLMAQPITQMPYQTIGNFVVTALNINDNDAETYRRELDLDAAVASTAFLAGGVRYERQLFASAPDGVIVMRHAADRPGAIHARLAWQLPGGGRAAGGGEDMLAMQLRNGGSAGIDGGLSAAAVAKLSARGGTVSREGDALVVRGADELVVLIRIATDYRRFDLVGGDPLAEAVRTLAAAAAKPFDMLRDTHVADHRSLFRSAALDLGRTPAAALSTDARVAISDPADDPALAALYFAYARYLLIACSRPGGQPANLQGMWNDSAKPPWGSKYTININTEMNYWLAEPTNLAECVTPLVAMIEELAVTGARTARAMYGARGWVAHHNTDLWRATAPIDFAAAGLWPTGGAWLALHLWEHYDYGRDRRFLQRVWPVMRDAALFFLDTLVPLPGTAYLVTNPSLSPENDHGRGGSVCAGPTMDMQMLRDLFDRCVAAGTLLKRDVELCRQFAAARARLVPNRIGAAGQLREWLEDWDLTARDVHHRHISHLFGIFPSHQINLDETPALAAAGRRSLELRGDAATGWGLAWRANVWARLRQGDHAHRLLVALLSSDRTYPNLFDAHPPFQIDGNFGGANAMAEMLVQSRGALIDLLPALPAAWPEGRLTGIRVRGAAEVDLAWTSGRLDEVVIRPALGGRRMLRHGTVERTVELRPGRQLRLRGPNLEV
ncbi:glycoside hydrolase family 95 protein [Sphingomonas quercus]|uniref:Glycoside hydrolase family 95 protein n=1 Tax=Sphingomonas quercus TaxID=2842451 RepID=A0ABS6BME6_9SPHN|nr:glycoside hydrolase family 95 protein [Sphingomonas quercus]MBU3079473.1 glycoside hydrolase family 95 protein [Sphingomonas quercus]